MSKRMQEYRNELNLIGNCNSKTGKLPLQPEQLSKVRKNKLTLQHIASTNRTIQQRRRLLCKQRGGNAAIDLLNIVKEHF